MTDVRDDGLTGGARELLLRLTNSGYLCWNSDKMEGPAHELIMAGYAEGRRPPRHRNWYIDITSEGRDAAVHVRPLKAPSDGDSNG